MKTTLALLAAAGASIALILSAQAKGPISARFCGASTCVGVVDSEAVSGVSRAAFSDEAVALAPAPAQPYYSLRLTLGGARAPRLTVYYLPHARLLRTLDASGAPPGGALWTGVDPQTDAALRDLARTLVPFAPPKVTAAFVGRRRVRHPSSYVGLYAVRSAGRDFLRGADWLTIRLRSRTASPWTDGANWLRYSPSTGVLVRDGEFVKLDRRTAHALQLGLALPH